MCGSDWCGIVSVIVSGVVYVWYSVFVVVSGVVYAWYSEYVI